MISLVLSAVLAHGVTVDLPPQKLQSVLDAGVSLDAGQDSGKDEATVVKDRRSQLQERLQKSVSFLLQQRSDQKGLQYKVSFYWSTEYVDEDNDSVLMLVEWKDNNNKPTTFVLMFMYRDARWRVIPDEFR